MTKKTVSISRALENDCEAVFKFHKDQTTEFIWPRSESELSELIEDRSLLISRINKEIVGMCYVKEGKNFCWEFGGICIDEQLQGYNFGTVLGLIAISNHYIAEMGKSTSLNEEKLITHVHEDNNLPRKMLKIGLGFKFTHKISIKDPKAPSTLRRNANGEIIGDEFLFNCSKLEDFAKWLKKFNGTTSETSKGVINLKIKIDIFKNKKSLLNSASTLIDISQLKSSDNLYRLADYQTTNKNVTKWGCKPES